MARPELIQKLSIGPETKLIAAIEQLTQADYKILLVVDCDGRLSGVVTDYDIRQAILKHNSLDPSMGEIMNQSPVVAGIGATESEIIALMRRTGCLQVPIIAGDGLPVDVRVQAEFLTLQQKPAECVAVVMAGGMGTRLRPITEQVPKPLLEVAGRPMLFLLLDQMISEGFNKIYVTLYYKSEMIVDRIRETSRYAECVEFIIEDEPLGTAGSLSLLQRRPAGPFLIINADLLTEVPLQELLQFHRRENNIITVALKREKFEVPYGIAEVSGGCIIALREKPELTMDVNTGVYIAEPAVLDCIRRGVKLDMPQLVNQLLAENQRVGSFPVHEFWLDVGTHEQYNRAQIRFDTRAAVDG
jgi:dTDP-glucose pyrophosphorylase